MRYAGKVFDKYLKTYAEPESQASAAVRLRYGRALVVPVTREDPDFIERYDRAASRATDRTLCIVVVNQSTNASQLTRAQNRSLLDALLGKSPERLWTAPNVHLVTRAPFDLLVVERLDGDCAIPNEQGVGLARKIGTDIAAALFRNGQLRSPWLYSTDADAQLPDDYFGFEPHPDTGALSFPFRHVAGDDGDIHSATLLYEIGLRYQVLGLAWAGSHYAFHGVGSALAVHAGAYCAARGFPKRAAGEDFHLLQKIAKLSGVVTPDVTPISISSRTSNRVPFGTGPAAERLSRGDQATLEAPECFVSLSRWLSFLESAKASDFSERSFLDHVPNDERDMWRDHLAAIGFSSFARATLGPRGAPAQLRERAAIWFDGLKCQQLLHRVRRTRYPQLPLEEALERAPFVPESVRHEVRRAELEAACERLLEAERQLPTQRGPRYPAPHLPGHS